MSTWDDLNGTGILFADFGDVGTFDLSFLVSAFIASFLMLSHSLFSPSVHFYCLYPSFWSIQRWGRWGLDSRSIPSHPSLIISDNDGDLDLFVCPERQRSYMLYINNGSCHFTLDSSLFPAKPDAQFTKGGKRNAFLSNEHSTRLQFDTHSRYESICRRDSFLV